MIELLVAGIVAFLAFWFGGKRQRDKQKAQQRQDYEDTKERLEGADTSVGDANADREWLRKRGQSDGD